MALHEDKPWDECDTISLHSPFYLCKDKAFHLKQFILLLESNKFLDGAIFLQPWYRPFSLPSFNFHCLWLEKNTDIGQNYLPKRLMSDLILPRKIRVFQSVKTWNSSPAIIHAWHSIRFSCKKSFQTLLTRKTFFCKLQWNREFSLKIQFSFLVFSREKMCGVQNKFFSGKNIRFLS